MTARCASRSVSKKRATAFLEAQNATRIGTVTAINSAVTARVSESSARSETTRRVACSPVKCTPIIRATQSVRSTVTVGVTTGATVATSNARSPARLGTQLSYATGSRASPSAMDARPCAPRAMSVRPATIAAPTSTACRIRSAIADVERWAVRVTAIEATVVRWKNWRLVPMELLPIPTARSHHQHLPCFNASPKT